MDIVQLADDVGIPLKGTAENTVALVNLDQLGKFAQAHAKKGEAYRQGVEDAFERVINKMLSIAPGMQMEKDIDMLVESFAVAVLRGGSQ